ncbi:hypothetical protein HMI55_006574 [Coelomomyces lativittatus]|nr:hypothetical protein HMI55_006574 [Coelomomyces lativittatus]
MRDLIDLWLSRYQEELTNSAMEQTSHGRATQHAPMKPRDVLLKALVEKEREDYRKFGLGTCVYIKI